MSGPARRRAAEAGLVGIAAVWGLTFVMVRDALDHLPAMAFLGYRLPLRRCWWRSCSGGGCAASPATGFARAR